MPFVLNWEFEFIMELDEVIDQRFFVQTMSERCLEEEAVKLVLPDFSYNDNGDWCGGSWWFLWV